MSDERITPGPWHVAYYDHNGQAVVSGEHTEICTCWHHSVGSIVKQMRANAHLIAAAPDLYEALEAFVAGDTDVSGTALIYDADIRALLALGRAALAKARGEQA